MVAARTGEGVSVFVLSLVHLSFGLVDHRHEAVVTHWIFLGHLSSC
jgi:hypothetical protein